MKKFPTTLAILKTLNDNAKRDRRDFNRYGTVKVVLGYSIRFRDGKFGVYYKIKKFSDYDHAVERVYELNSLLNKSFAMPYGYETLKQVKVIDYSGDGDSFCDCRNYETLSF